jgi:NAD(P)-dependent dehydrogenase (short-subunit alcohol dehydrogenase family)
VARLEGKAIVLTGATGGLGQVLSRALVEAGAVVGMLSRSVDQASCDAVGPGAVPLPADVTDDDALAAALQGFRDAHGPVHCLIANAGISPMVRLAPDLGIEDFRRVVEVNLVGAYKTVWACAPHLAPEASIVFTGSVMASRPAAGLSAYAASKAGLEGLGRALAVDLSPRGVRVNSVALGWFTSPMSEGYFTHHRSADEVLGPILANRIGAAEDLPGVFLFLASDESRYVTGQTFTVDGGFMVG